MGWEELQGEISLITSKSGRPFAAETILNARDFLGIVRGNCPIPKVAKGYGETIRLSWEGCEVEIFENRLELYRFYNKWTDIQEIAHKPGEPFPDGLLGDLPENSN
jgi:hypothetical protein